MPQNPCDRASSRGLVCLRVSDGVVLFASPPWPEESLSWLLDHARWANRKPASEGFVWMSYEVLPETSA